MEIFRSEINVFLEVVKAGSLSRAAEVLGLNQPAISKAIARLESESKSPLLVRSREGVKLTQKGVELLGRIRAFDHQISHHSDLTHLKIGLHQSLAMNLLPALMPRLKRTFPLVELTFEFMPSLDVTRRVASLDLDAGIVINPLKRQQLIFKPLGKDYVSLWQSKRSSGVHSLTLIHPDMYLAARFKKGAEVQQISDYEVIARMVDENPGYSAVLPAEIARRHGLKLVNEKKLLEVTINLIFHEERFSKEARKGLIEAFTL